MQSKTSLATYKSQYDIIIMEFSGGFTMSKITVVGSFSMDLTVTMDEFPLAGQTIIGKKLIKNPGGKGANQCIACARLGGDVEMIGMLGEDENACEIKELFMQEGVNIEHVLSTKEEPTTIALIEVNQSGQNRIIVVPAANFKYSVNDLQNVKDTIAKTELVVAQLEMQLEVVEELVKMCDELNVPIILNPAPAVVLKEDVLSKVTYLTPNETELSVLTGHSVETIEEIKEAANILLNQGVKNLIVTLGDKGALLANQKEMTIIEGYPVKAIDTVAAGDSFNGALAKGIVDGMKIEDAIRLANAVGALTVTKSGAIPSLPSKEEVEVFLKGKE